MHLLLQRFAFGELGTFGRLRLFAGGEQKFVCYTIENPVFPWVRENERNVSAIPVGTYKIVRGMYHRNTATPEDDYPCLVIPDGEVPDRGPGVKIHSGNTVRATAGCPIVGDEIGFLADWPAVFRSRIALRNLLGAWDANVSSDDEPHLKVSELRARDVR